MATLSEPALTVAVPTTEAPKATVAATRATAAIERVMRIRCFMVFLVSLRGVCRA